MFAAHLYRHGQERLWASVLVGALLYIKGRSLPELMGDLVHQLRLPEGVRHVWVVDRGLLSRPLLRALTGQGQFALGRLRRNQVVYFAPRRQKKGRGRKRTHGAKCRVDRLLARFAERLRHERLQLHVQGRERRVHVASAEVLLWGVEAGRPLAARAIVVVVERSKLKPWYLLTTDLELAVEEAVRAYGGRQQIEVNFDEVKELGLGHYMGRSAQGVRRWPLFLCAEQMMLKFTATGVIEVRLPALHWSWSAAEHTVGQIRRRLIEHCRPRISRRLAGVINLREIKKAA